MSQDNIELVRRMYDRWNARDLEGTLATLHPDLRLLTSGAFPGLDPVYESHDGFRRFWHDFYDVWVRLAIMPERLDDLGDRVMALWVFEGEGRDGLEVRRHGGQVASVREDLVVRLDTYADWSAACTAVGLRQ